MMMELSSPSYFSIHLLVISCVIYYVGGNLTFSKQLNGKVASYSCWKSILVALKVLKFCSFTLRRARYNELSTVSMNSSAHNISGGKENGDQPFIIILISMTAILTAAPHHDGPLYSALHPHLRLIWDACRDEKLPGLSGVG